MASTDLIGAMLRSDMAGFNSAAQQSLVGQHLAIEAARAAAGGTTTLDEAMRIGLRSSF